MDVLAVFIIEVCVALLLSRTLATHARAFLRRLARTLRKPCLPRTAHKQQSATTGILESPIVNS
jgi:hypothetical protein